MRIGIVFDLKEDYGIQNEDTDYYDFCFLSEAEAAFNHLQLAGYDVFYIGNQFLNICRFYQIRKSSFLNSLHCCSGLRKIRWTAI